jgi:hypothetical protein
MNPTLVAALREVKNGQTETLDLSGKSIEDEEVIKMVNCSLSSPSAISLTELNLNGNKIASNLALLSDLFCVNPSLNTIELRSNGIREGLDAFSSFLTVNKALTCINIGVSLLLFFSSSFFSL